MSFEHLGESIREERDGGSIAYQLSDSRNLNMTGYKVLQNFGGKGLLRAMRTQLNGNVRLIYDIKDYKTMAALLPTLGPDAFCSVVSSMLQVYDKIRNNGFIQSETISLEPERIFVDITTMTANLIYLPLVTETDSTMQLNGIEIQLRETLMEWMEHYPNVTDYRTRQLRNYLQGKGNPLERAGSALETAEETGWRQPDETSFPPAISLVRVGGGQPLVLAVAASGVLIGRDPAKAQCIIGHSSVSAKHCRIFRGSGSWLLEDLQSRNGTKVNGRLLAAHEPNKIYPDDNVEISNFVFQVKVGNGGGNGKM